VTIRPAVPEDVEALREIFRAASLSNPGDRTALLAHPEVLLWSGDSIAEGQTWVAIMDDGTIAGFATAVPTDGALELDDLFVAPNRMRQGVAGRLIEAVATHARHLGTGSLHVTANPHALAFYESAGFVPDGFAETRFGPAQRLRLDIEIH
jgi:GNAT superfamily N-acetyltransferase